MLNEELTEDDLNNSENVIINIINSEFKKINNINWVSVKIPKYALSSTEININYNSPEYIYFHLIRIRSLLLIFLRLKILMELK